MKKLLVLAAVMTVMAPAMARGQEGAPQVPAPAAGSVELPAPEKPKPATVFVTLQTAQGPIVLELEEERAPVTTANFLRYVDAKMYDGQNFYRALNMAEDFGLIQGGVTKLKPGQKLFPAIAHEPTSKTGLSHQTGTISMARAAEGTARMDFFITVGDMSGLDARPENPGDNSGFAAFGHVVDGMEIVRTIMKGAISPTLGADSGMQGQMLAAPVGIITARRSAAPPRPPAGAAAQP